jgi:hypothetical protein
MLTRTSFGQTAVSAVRPALGTNSASRERPGTDHPHPLGLVRPCPLPFQPLTLSVGVRAPAPKLPALASATRPPSAPQRPLGLGASTRYPERLATSLRRRFNTVTDAANPRGKAPAHAPCTLFAPSFSATRVTAPRLRPSAMPGALREKLKPAIGYTRQATCNPIVKEEHPNSVRLPQSYDHGGLRASRR